MKSVASNYRAWDWRPINLDNASIEQKLRFFASSGILAANIHNTQPWKFKINGNILEIHPEKEYMLLGTDPLRRCLYMSLGCCTRNIEIAAAHYGFKTKIEVCGEKKGASIKLGFTKNTKKDKFAKLCTFIPLRYSNKFIYKKTPLKQSQLGHFLLTLDSAKIKLVNNRTIIDRLAVLQFGATRKLMNGSFGRELSSWLRSNNTRAFDGMPGFVVGFSLPMSFIGKLVLRFSTKPLELMAKKDKILLASTPVVGVITTKDDSVSSWIDAGRLFEHTALVATSLGLHIAPMHAISEDLLLSKETLNITGEKDVLQMLCRIGYSTHTDEYHTPRKPVDMVFI